MNAQFHVVTRATNERHQGYWKDCRVPEERTTRSGENGLCPKECRSPSDKVVRRIITCDRITHEATISGSRRSQPERSNWDRAYFSLLPPLALLLLLWPTPFVSTTLPPPIAMIESLSSGKVLPLANARRLSEAPMSLWATISYN